MKNIFNTKFNKNTIYRIISIMLFLSAVSMTILALLPAHFGSHNDDQEIVFRNAKEVQGINVMDEVTNVSVGFVKDGNSNINNLVQNYYTSLMINDDKLLSKYTDDVESIDTIKRNITSQYVEAFDNLECYTMQGLLEKTYIVVAVSEIKYKDVNTLAPNIDYFYACTDISGNIYISNKPAGEEIESYNDMMYSNTLITDMANEVAWEYDEAMNRDVGLNNLFVSFKNIN